jgi:hypothetical protein
MFCSPFSSLFPSRSLTHCGCSFSKGLMLKSSSRITIWTKRSVPSLFRIPP